MFGPYFFGWAAAIATDPILEHPVATVPNATTVPNTGTIPNAMVIANFGKSHHQDDGSGGR